MATTPHPVHTPPPSVTHDTAPASDEFDPKATLAHELRTPISALVTLAEVIETEQFGAVGDQRYLEYAARIRETAAVAMEIVDRQAVEDATQSHIHSTTADTHAEFDLTDLVRRCIAIVGPLADDAQVDLEYRLNEQLPRIMAQPTAIMQILLNILTNAIKFTPVGGHVTVTTRCQSLGHLVVDVQDSGLGMTPQQVAILVGDAGESNRLSPEPRRPGVGAAVMQRLVRLCNGVLNVESERGRGTCVRVTLPQNPLS